MMLFRTKQVVIAMTLLSMLAAPLAEAARVGKGRSAGMQRALPSRSYQAPPPRSVTPPQAPPQTAQTKPRPGVGTAIAAGVAGAAAGYMLGSATNQPAAPVAQSAAPNKAAAPDALSEKAPNAPGIPWGTILILAVILIGGLMWFRRKAGVMRAGTAATATDPNTMRRMPNGDDTNRFPPIPPIGSGTNISYGSSASMNQGQAYALQRLPEGTETPYFLRQAKATFLHLQSLNTPESMEEVRKYMTSELFNALCADLSSNTDVADFPQLDCELVAAQEEGAGHYVATVRFFGRVSEAVGAPEQPFSEYWHYVKDGQAGRWLVAGIQQD